MATDKSLPLAPPSVTTTLGEIRAPIEWFKSLLSKGSYQDLPQGDGRPIILAPGYLADEYSMWPLKRFLNKLGYRAYDWQLGRNKGEVDRDIVRLGQVTGERFFEHQESPVTLIGWSLGGVVVREVARLFEPYVREVITLGSPITGGPKYTAPGRRYARKKQLDLDSFEQHVLARNQLGIRQPVTSIYSQQDGIVAWQASIDVYNQHARNIEVSGTHLGLGVNRQVWANIANTLAQSAQ